MLNICTFGLVDGGYTRTCAHHLCRRQPDHIDCKAQPFSRSTVVLGGVSNELEPQRHRLTSLHSLHRARGNTLIGTAPTGIAPPAGAALAGIAPAGTGSSATRPPVSRASAPRPPASRLPASLDGIAPAGIALDGIALDGTVLIGTTRRHRACRHHTVATRPHLRGALRPNEVRPPALPCTPC